MKRWLSIRLLVVLGLSLAVVGCASGASNSASGGASGASGAASGASKPSATSSSSAASSSSASTNSSASNLPAATLKLGHNSAEGSVTDKALKNWSKTLSDKTGGKLKLEVYPQNQLGTNKELSDQTGMGSIDMNVQGLSALVDFGLQEGYLAKVPFLFNSLDGMIGFWQGEDGKAIMKKLEPKGVMPLSVGLNRMPRQMASRNKPLNGPEDIKGLKVRAGDIATNSALKVLNAVPTNIALNEMYTATSQGMVDVVELPLDYIYNYSMFEVAKYLTLTNHTFDLQWVLMNKKRFDSLPPEYQKVLTETIPGLEKENNKAMDEEFNSTLTKLKDKGMTVIETDRSKWSALIPGAVPELEKTWPNTKGYFEKILKLK